MQRHNQFTHQFVVQSLGDRLASSSTKERVYSCVSTDSRALPEHALFVALQGDHFDGHDFIAQAVQKGATGLLIQAKHRLSSELEKQSQITIYRVDDTLQALRQLAATWRQRFDIPVLAIGGSVGKTTSKEILAAILSGRYQSILKTTASQNGFLGIPLTLLALNNSHQVAVIEIGIDAVDAMRQHVELVKPNLSLLSKIAPEHMEFFKNMDVVAQEECQLLSGTVALGGRCAINLDDPWISQYFSSPLSSDQHSEHIFYTVDQKQKATTTSPTQLLVGTLALDGKNLNIERQGSKFTLGMRHEGVHNAANLLGAVAMALALGLTPEEIAYGWQSYQPLSNRSNVVRIPQGPIIIRDEYNASPASVEAALQLMAAVAPASGKRVVCLGDMLELGEQEEHYHRQLLEPLIDSGTSHLLTFGHRAAWLADELKKNSKAQKINVKCHSNHQALGEEILSLLNAGDVLLIKGSRGMHLEKVLPLLSEKWPYLSGKSHSK